MSKRHLIRRATVAVAIGALVLGVGVPDASAAGPAGADGFNAAPLLPPGNGVYTGDTAHATKQPGEGEHADSFGGCSVWWKYRRSTGATIRITTKGSNFDTVLGVYRGGSVNALTLIADNDDAPPDDALYSRLQFNAQAGVTYRIVVDGYNGSSDDNVIECARGAYALHISRIM